MSNHVCGFSFFLREISRRGASEPSSPGNEATQSHHAPTVKRDGLLVKDVNQRIQRLDLSVKLRSSSETQQLAYDFVRFMRGTPMWPIIQLGGYPYNWLERYRYNYDAKPDSMIQGQGWLLRMHMPGRSTFESTRSLLDEIVAAHPSIEQINMFKAGPNMRTLGFGPLDEYRDQYGVVVRTSLAVGDQLAGLYNEYLQPMYQALKIDSIKLDLRGTVCFQSIDPEEMRVHYVYLPNYEALRSKTGREQVLERLNSRVQNGLFIGGFECESD